MFTRLLIPMILCFCLIVAACLSPVEPVRVEVQELTSLEKNVIQAGNDFSLTLLRELNNQERSENLFISPLSVSIALGMTLNGAAGKTREAMTETLELQGLSIEEINQSYQSLMYYLMNVDPSVIIKIANAIWYRQGFYVEQDFLDVNNKYFDAVVEELNFYDPKAVDIINGWISNNTNGLIEEMIEEIDPATVMFLINAIYFKGIWKYEFDPDDTIDDYFTTYDGEKKPVRMMQQSGGFHYYANDHFRAIDLPYGEDAYSMSIFLPHREVDIDDFISTIYIEGAIYEIHNGFVCNRILMNKSGCDRLILWRQS